MAEGKIGAKIVIDGEAEFRANLTSAKTALNKFQSELKLVNAVYKDNANSLAALRDKQQVYINLQQEQRNKVHLLTEIQDKAVKKYKEEQSTLEDLRQKKKVLINDLEKAKEQYGENSEEVRKLTSELNDVNKQYEAQERIVQKTGDKVNRYGSDLNSAEAELAELNGEVERNERYLAEAENSIDECAASIDEYGNEVQESTDKTSLFADVLKAELLSGAIKEGIRAIANGIKTIAAAATQTGSTFEASMSQVAATMGMTTEEIESGSREYEILNKAAQDCGKATMFSASQSAEALNYLALAGYDAEKAAATLPKVLNLAAAGGLDLAYASDLVTDSMAALGMETSELDNYIDEMAKTSQKSNTSVAQLGEATLVCAGTVAMTEQSLETMNTALGVMANNGLKGAEGGTHLRNVLLSLSAPTKNAKEAIVELGLRVYDSKGKMRDLNDIMTDLNNKTAQMAQEDRTKLISKMFNKTDIAAVNALLKSTNGEYSALNAQIKNCSGAAQAMADTLNDNLKGRVTILQSALEGLGITAYNLFDDEMREAVDSATDAVGRLQDEIDNGDLGVSLRNMSEALGEFATNAIGAAEKALPLLIDGFTWLLENGEIVAGLIGGVTSAKTAYTVATEAATVAQKLFNVTADANPYIFLATAIAGVVGAVTLYSKTAGTAAAQLTESTKKLTDASKKLNEETVTASRQRAETKAGYEAEKDACIRLAEELDELQGKTSLTSSEQARQAAIIDELNTAIPDLNLYIDEQTGLVNMSTEALLENIDAQMALMKAEAAREDLAEIAAEQYKNENQLAELEAQRIELIEKRSSLYAELKEEADGAWEIRYSDESQKALAQYNEDIKALTNEISTTKGTIDELGAEYEQTMSYIADNESMAKASEDMQQLGDAALGAGADISRMSDEIMEEYNGMLDSLQKNIWNQMDLFSKFSNEVKISKDEILGNMQSQVDGVSQWAENLDILADRHINQGLLKYLAEMGPRGSAYVAAFVDMSTDQLEEAGKMFEESAKLSASSAMNITDSYFEAGRSACDSYIEGAESGLDEVREAIVEMAGGSLAAYNAELKMNYRKTGEDSSEGYREGVISGTSDVFEAVKAMGDGAVSALRTAVRSHSPSEATKEIGGDFDEGLQLGISGNSEKVFDAIRQLAAGALKETRMGLPTEEFTEIGRKVAEGIREGVESGKSGVIAAIQLMCASAVGTAKSALDIHSPSRAFAYLGRMSGEGYIAGWEDTMANINSVITDSLPDIRVKDTHNAFGAEPAGVSASRVYDMCKKMYDIMVRYMPGMSKMQMVTDTGALVGEIIPQLDKEFGEMEYDKSRGLYE